MTPLRAGAYATAGDAESGARKSVLVHVLSDLVLIESKPLPGGLGFDRDRGLQAGRALGRRLHELSERVAAQQPADLAAAGDDDLAASLQLTREASIEMLVALRAIGAALRAELADDVVEELQFNGFLSGDDEPAITFQEHDRPPICWEMLYEGSQAGSPEWSAFWGLRVPITHWAKVTRTEEIRLSNGVFSASNDELRFAGCELDRLPTGVRLKRTSLAEKFQNRVRSDLLERMHGDAERAEAWWQLDPQGPWLRRYLEEQAPGAMAADLWKQDRLIEILKNDFRYDVVHFACHCEPSDESEFLSKLELTVGGEPVCLDVSLMVSDARRRIASREDRGPLVFLNACGTGQQSAVSFEPPGFPEKWIINQGALAVIATLCPVPDYFAHAFAVKFYETLFGAVMDPARPRERFVADALLATRRHFMEHYDNPLGLAYVLYAVKGAHVLADFAAEADA